MDKAFEKGEICWSKVREMTRVVTPKVEAKWLAYAKTHTAEEVQNEVKRTREGEEPKSRNKGTPDAYSKLSVRMPTHIHQTFNAAVTRRMEEGGEGTTPVDAIKAMAEADLARDPEDKKRPKVMIVYHVGPDGSTWMDGQDGPIPVPPEVVKEETANAETCTVEDIENPGDLEAIKFGERGSVPPEDRDPEVSYATKMAVLMRDGFRCVICGSNRSLRIHHLKSRANGGKSIERHLISTCLRCHSLLHAGIMKLKWDKDRRLIPLDSEGNPLSREGGMAEILKDSKLPLIVTVTRPATGEETQSDNQSETQTPESEESAILSILSVENLPPELSPAQTEALSRLLDWNVGQRLFVIRPDEGLVPGVPRCSQNKKANPTCDSEKTGPEESARWSHGFAAIIGQPTVVADLSEAAQAARERGEPLDHVLLAGPPGLGKTTLAQVLAAEMGTRCHKVTAASIEQPHHLVTLLAGLSEGDIVFIDEIHGLDKRCEECLYSALEYGYIDLLIDQEGRRRTIRAHLRSFTLVGATTQLGDLAKPFRDRFTLREELAFYTDDELTAVVEREARRLGTPVNREAAKAIAVRARGTPREAIRILKRVRDRALATGSHELTPRHVEAVAQRLGIDENGLCPRDREILELLLTRNRPMGLETIAMMLSVDPKTLRGVYEPYLVKQGYVIRTPRGRRATAKAHLHYGARPSEGAQDDRGEAAV
jgi:Holliday junction DNA helicase RuvB